MLRKSVETRDWVNTIEPRNVRAVMKRVVEDTTSIDVQVMHQTFFTFHVQKKKILDMQQTIWIHEKRYINS